MELQDKTSLFVYCTGIAFVARLPYTVILGDAATSRSEQGKSEGGSCRSILHQLAGAPIAVMAHTLNFWRCNTNPLLTIGCIDTICRSTASKLGDAGFWLSRISSKLGCCMLTLPSSK